MDEDFKKNIDSYAKDNQFGVSPIPVHVHNGTDSPQIDPADLLGFPTTLVSNATVAPTSTPLNGTFIYQYDASGRYVMWSRINKVWVAISMGTTPSGIYELLANKSTNTSLGTSDTLYPTQNAVKVYADAHSGIASLSADPTPTLGGNLDTNDYYIGSEGSRIRRYSYLKTVPDATTTSLFQIDMAGNGVITININYQVGYIDASSTESNSGLCVIRFAHSGIQAVSSPSTKYNTDLHTGAGTGAIGPVFTTDTSTDGRCIVKVSFNNDAGANNTFVSIVDTIADIGGYTLTEL